MRFSYFSTKDSYVLLKWTLFFHQISEILRETLEAAGAKGMVVGHTPQVSGINWYLCLKIFCITSLFCCFNHKNASNHFILIIFLKKIEYMIKWNVGFFFAANMIVAYGESMWECPVVFLILDLRYVSRNSNNEYISLCLLQIFSVIWYTDCWGVCFSADSWNKRGQS